MKKKKKLEATRITPFVNYDTTEGIFEIKGRSAPEVSLNFYSPIYDMLENYDSDKKELVANFALEYFNTSSTKCLVGIFRRLSDIQQKKGIDVQVNWYFEEDDEDVMEIGEDLESIVDLEFNFVEQDVDEMDIDFTF